MAWLRERYLVQGARIGDIAAEVGCGELAVRAALARARLPLRGVPLRYPQLRDRSWLWLRYVKHAVSVRGIAGELGCDESAVYEALDAAAIARIRPRGGRPRQFPELDDPPWLRHRYLDQGRSQRELAAEILPERCQATRHHRDPGRPGPTGRSSSWSPPSPRRPRTAGPGGEADPLPAGRGRVYEAAVTITRWVVFLLFAEQRSLLPQGEAFTLG